jgi:hypothetical protein
MAVRSEGFDIGHPAPHRDRISIGLLMLGVLGAPLAWTLQFLLLYGFASELCRVDQAPPSWAHWLLPFVNLAGLAGAALVLGLSFAHLRATRGEHDDQVGGMIDAGEGRTRFLAIWGIWIGILFMLAIAFNTISVFWRGLCAA